MVQIILQSNLGSGSRVMFIRIASQKFRVHQGEKIADEAIYSLTFTC